MPLPRRPLTALCALILAVAAAPAACAQEPARAPAADQAGASESSELSRAGGVVTLSEEAGAALWTMLEAFPRLSPGLSGGALYMITFRDCPPCLVYKRAEFPALHAAGVDTRVVLFSPFTSGGAPLVADPDELRVVAALNHAPDWETYEAWMRPGAPSSEIAAALGADAPVAEAVATAREGAQAVYEMLDLIEADIGLEPPIPVFAWREGERVHVGWGVGARTRAAIREGLSVALGADLGAGLGGGGNAQ